MFPRYLQYLLTDFRQTFVTGASWDTNDLITFLVQKVKVQGHTIAAEAHSTRRYRRVQLFLVRSLFYLHKISLHLPIRADACCFVCCKSKTYIGRLIFMRWNDFWVEYIKCIYCFCNETTTVINISSCCCCSCSSISRSSNLLLQLVVFCFDTRGWVQKG